MLTSGFLSFTLRGQENGKITYRDISCYAGAFWLQYGHGGLDDTVGWCWRSHRGKINL
jgi:hypothetical protein